MSRAREIADLGSPAASGLSNRNLIINGSMCVYQRGSGTLPSGTSLTYYGPDRWRVYKETSTAVATLSQDTDVPSGQGFKYSYKIDVTTGDSSVAAGDRCDMIYRFEGQDLQQLKKGTSSAESVTLQFWVKSPKTGTHICELFDNDNSRQISKAYTVNTANTWEYKTITFEGDTTGTLDSDANLSLQIAWWLIAGSTYSGGTLNTSWATNTSANRAVGQVNVLDDAANNFLITGVQLEIGDVATPFEHRSYGDELARCQRYYLKLGGADINGGGYYRYGVGSCQGINNSNIFIKPTVTMRTTPTLETTGTVSNYGIYEADAVHACTALPSFNSGNSNPNGFAVSFTTTNGLVASGNASEALNNNNTTAYLAFSAEI